MTLSDIKGRIEGIAFGAEGILRHEGKVVFVPYVLLGEEIHAQVYESKKSYARARLLAIEAPSAHRVDPKCAYFGTCGGCQLQHADAQSQMDIKTRFVEDALSRVGKITASVNPCIGTSHTYGYRRQVRLRFWQGEFLGYARADGAGLLPIDACPLFELDTDLWQTLHSLVAFLGKSGVLEGALAVFKQDQGYVLHVMPDAPLGERLKTRLGEWQKSAPHILGVLASDGRSRFQVGTTALSFEVEGLKIQYDPLCFVQNHPEQSAKIYAALKKLAEGKRRVVDLYCGIGVTSLLSAHQGAEVWGIEANPQAIDFAKGNAKLNRLQVDFRAARVEKALPQLLKTANPDFIIVNPPRTGLTPDVATLLAQKTNEMVYVSCMPATLARDLKILTEGGLKIKEVQPVDQFPQTTHVETWVHLVRE